MRLVSAMRAMGKATPAPSVRAQRRYWIAVFVFAVLAAWIFYLRPPLLGSLRALAFDAYQRTAPLPALPDSPVKVVQIDEASLERLGQWPWPRTTMAELTARLRDAGAAAIAFDVLFTEPDRTSPEEVFSSLPSSRREALLRELGTSARNHDAVFAQAIAEAPSVLAVTLHGAPNGQSFPVRAGFAAAGDDPIAFLPTLAGVSSNLAIFNDSAAGAGFINWLPDHDQIVRRVPLLFSYNDAPAPSLSLESLRVALGASTYVIRSSNASGAQAWGAHTGIESIRLGPIEIPTDADGQLWMRFRPYDPDQAIPAWRVLSGEIDENLEGTIVLIGASAPGLMDLRATPLDRAIPGVEIHRQVLEQILSGAFLTRPDFAPGIELIVSVIVIFLLALAAPRLRPEINAGLSVTIVTALWIAGFLLFARAGYLFDPIFPTLSAMVFGAAATTYFYRQTERQRVEIRRAFNQYVAPSVVRQLEAHPERLKLGGEVRELTILICDIRNFSAIAEAMSAEELTSFINSFLTPLSDIIIESGGTIDKYMGDAILAFWNAPLDQPDHAERACNAALAIVSRMAQLNEVWRSEANAAGRAFEDVRIGIGLNSGQACVGNLGSEKRFDYSAIGDSVNIASRLEGLTKVYGVTMLVSEETRAHGPEFTFIETGIVRLKGRAAPTRVFTFLEGVSAPSSHAQFLVDFEAGRLEEANRLLCDLELAAPPDMRALYRHYRERIDQARAAPSEDFDPVFDPDHK
ncbi:MAG: adenylate/guanylate cyclase domain-containing protein [Hyphomonadaceae bacterium]